MDLGAAEQWAATRFSGFLEAGLTQEALALESGLSRNQLVELEHGRRGGLFERLDDLADALGVPVADLVS
jgi:transcriptional regulator with XRE-family HTH domain